MASKRYFLDETGLKFLANELIKKMDLKINSRLVTLMTEESTNDEFPSAKAVYDAIGDALGSTVGVKFSVVDELPEEGESGTIYLIKNGDVYVQWVYVGDNWLELGSTEVNLEGYWSEDTLEPITNADILDILEEVGLGIVTPPTEPEEEEEPEP